MSETLRCTAIVPAGPNAPVPMDVIVLTHDERRVRRKRLVAQHGDVIVIDLPEAVTLGDRDRLMLEDGRAVEVIAAEEDVLRVTGRDPAHLAELAWHLGNRHVPVAFDVMRHVDGGAPRDFALLVARDAVLARMLEGLGARVREAIEPFEPVRGAYHSHGELHDRDHARSHEHSHAHGGMDPT